jgi:maltose alpha-D-glucosyltransferase/alpha-amylase
VVGALELHRRKQEPSTLAILQGYVSNEGDAWQYTLDALSSYFERALATHCPVPPVALATQALLGLTQHPAPSLARDLIGAYLESARLLGQRTGELHAALAAELEDPHFTPEPFSPHYQRSVYQSMRNLTGQVMRLLAKRVGALPAEVRELGQKLLAQEGDILQRFRTALEPKITALRIRCHGDYHLGQVLYTGKDFTIIDFEGEPSRPLSERRMKRTPLRDVVGMIRSFHYAAFTTLLSRANGRGMPQGVIRPEDLAVLEPWARYWYVWVSVAFLKAYFEVARPASFLPRSDPELRVLFDAYLLEKAIYELGYELNHRPDWVHIPLSGIAQLLEEGR